MNTNASHRPAARNSWVKVATLIAIASAAVMVIAGLYGEAARHLHTALPTVTTTGFNPCHPDQAGTWFPVQVKMQFAEWCAEQSMTVP
jgi:hypothetical protein